MVKSRQVPQYTHFINPIYTLSSACFYIHTIESCNRFRYKKENFIKYPKKICYNFQYIVRIVQRFRSRSYYIKRRKKTITAMKKKWFFPCFLVLISMQMLWLNERNEFFRQFSYLFGWKLWKKSKLSHDMSENGTNF